MKSIQCLTSNMIRNDLELNMNIATGKADALSGNLNVHLAQYRHKVFVETLGWELNCKDGLELDQFDREDTVYVVSRDDGGHVNGCARLLPTHRPYLLGEVFPELMAGQPVPCNPEIWELSRFAAVDFNNSTAGALNQFSSAIAVKVLQESIACAISMGAKRLITVSPIGVERLLRRAGFRAHRAGPPMIIGGHPIFACWIDLEAYADKEA